MATEPIPQLHKPEAGSPFCSDPNCAYCKLLRSMFDRMRKDNGLERVSRR
jgi:hypothetical protein